ncbi:conjugal transfer protein TraB [Streptomyces capparidis]
MSDPAPRAGDPAPRTGAAPAPADSDNRYKAVQAKLATLAKIMDDGALELEALHREMKVNATRTERAALDIAHGGLDPKFVELTNDVAEALGGAAVEVNNLSTTAEQVATSTHQAKRTHSRLYGALDDIRSNRRERTPKPGFFTR